MFQKYITNLSLNKIELNFSNIIISLLIAPLFAGIVPKLIDMKQSYKEFTVGTITFLGQSKNIDYIIILGFSFGFLVSYLALNKILHSVSYEQYVKFKEKSIIVSIPAIIWIGSLLFSKELNMTLLILSSTLQLYLIISYLIQSNNKEFVSYTLLSTVFSIFSIFAWALLVNRFFDIDVSWLLKVSNPYLSSTFIAVLVLFLLVYSVLFYKFQNNKNQILGLTQLSLPFLFMFLIPQKVMHGNQLISIYPATDFLYYSIVFMVLFAIGLIVKKIYLSSNLITENISSISFIAILFFIKSYLIVIPSVSSDDYHFGEFLLPFWSWIEYGQIPFNDLVPARGLINYLDGFFASVFLELQASYFGYIKNFLMFFYVSILFLIIRKYVNIFFAFMITLLFATFDIGVSGIDVFNTVLMVFLAQLFIGKKYYKFLVFSLLLITVSILFAPGQGGILAISITPLGIYALYKVLSHDFKMSMKFFSFLVIPYVLIIGLTPLFDMLYGAILYAKEQSSLNSISYGTPWYFSIDSFANGNYWLFEIVRSGYVTIIGFSSIVFLKYLTNSELQNRREVLVYSSIILVTSLLLIIRGAGRIDPGAFSRLGLASIFIIGILLPLLVHHILPRYKSMIAMGFIVFYISIFGYVGNTLSLNQLISKVDAKTHLPSNFQYTKDTSIVNMGNGVFDDTHIKRIVKIKTFLKTILDKNETFLNLTNRNALYFYLNRKPPIETGAFYNLVSEGQQRRAIKKLLDDVPKVAILEADNFTHDGVKLPLRSSLLYRFVIQNYQPIEIDGIIYGIRNDLFKEFEVQISKQEQQKLYDKVFLTSNLKYVPSEWGNNTHKLSEKLVVVQKLNSIKSINHLEKIKEGYKITGDDPFIIYKTNNKATENMGYLSFEFNCLDSLAGINHFEIYFKSNELEFSENRMLRFDSLIKNNIVPLESSPRYLQLNNLEAIRIDLTATSSCKKFKISNISLLQKKEVEQFELTQKVQLHGVKKNKLTPFRLTDENWINGVSKNGKKFFITNEDYQYFKFKVGDAIKVESLGMVVITDIEKDGVFVNVKFKK